MKDKWKVITVMMVMLMMLAGCSRYSSRYNAVDFTQRIDNNSASVKFTSFEGTFVFRLKTERSEGEIHYQGNLDTGSITVYYDYIGAKEKLFTLSGGNTVDSTGGYIEKGIVNIIIESNGECSGGDFQITIDSD